MTSGRGQRRRRRRRRKGRGGGGGGAEKEAVGRHGHRPDPGRAPGECTDEGAAAATVSVPSLVLLSFEKIADLYLSLDNVFEQLVES